MGIAGAAILGILAIVGIFYTMNEETKDEISDLPKTIPTEVSDSALIEKKVDANKNKNFYIDENGIKHYSLSAVDSPDLHD